MSHIHGQIEPCRSSLLQIHVRPTYSLIRKQQQQLNRKNNTAAGQSTGLRSSNVRGKEEAAIPRSKSSRSNSRPTSAQSVVNPTSYEDFRSQLQWEEEQAKRQFLRDLSRRKDDVSNIQMNYQVSPHKNGAQPISPLRQRQTGGGGGRPQSAASGVSRQTLVLLEKSLQQSNVGSGEAGEAQTSQQRRAATGTSSPSRLSQQHHVRGNIDDRGKNSIGVMRMVDSCLAQQRTEAPFGRSHVRGETSPHRPSIHIPRPLTPVDLNPPPPLTGAPPPPSYKGGSGIEVSYLDDLETVDRTFVVEQQRHPQYVKLPGDGRMPLINFAILDRAQLEALKPKSLPGANLRERIESASRKRKAIDASREFWKTTKKNPPMPHMLKYY